MLSNVSRPFEVRAATTHEFSASLRRSAAMIPDEDWERWYRSIWPDMLACTPVHGRSALQLGGVDRVLYLTNRPTPLYLEEKVRAVDYDDFLVEEYSSLEARTPGWTVDPKKYTDYLAYVTPKRAVLLPYDTLRRAVVKQLPAWKRELRPVDAANEGYTTRNWPVPWCALYDALVEQAFIQPTTPMERRA